MDKAMNRRWRGDEEEKEEEGKVQERAGASI